MCFKGEVCSKFRGSYKGNSRGFLWCFYYNPLVLQGCFMGFQGCFEDALRVVKGVKD